MTSCDTFDSKYCIVSQGDDDDNSLMLKFEFFSTEQEYVNTLSMKNVPKLNSCDQEDLNKHKSKPLSSDKYAHNLKNKLKYRISSTLRRVNRRSWVSSRYKLNSAKFQHDQICEFINAVSQTRTPNEEKQRSIKIMNIDHMSNSEQLEESTYNSFEQLKDHIVKNQELQDELCDMKYW